ncbi:MAG: NUDIX hydrolase [Deltaproteobacteria bacterium]|nr:NUDIX hydrolase [Deltaproteobacteria bacterium]
MTAPRPTVAVGAIVFDDQGRVLLIKRGRPPAVGMWSLPGGKVEGGETLAAAVAREVLEETGVTVEVGALVEVVERIVTEDDLAAPRWHYVILDYLARVVRGTTRAADDADDVGWFTIDDLDAAPLTDGLLPVIDKARRLAGDAG